MRFTSKLKKKINDISKKLNENDCCDDGLNQDVTEWSRIKLPSHTATVTYADCKYCKLVPKMIGSRLQDEYDLMNLHNTNMSDFKISRFKHLNIIAKFIFSSKFCFNSHRPKQTLQLSKKLKKETKSCRTEASDIDTVCMLKILKEFQKEVKRAIQCADGNNWKSDCDVSASCHMTSLFEASSYAESQAATDGADGYQRTEKPAERNNNSALICNVNSAPAASDLGADECSLLHRSYHDNHDKMKMQKFSKGNCVSEQYVRRECCVLDGVKDTSQTKQVLEIHYSSRFGEVNERHCNAVMRLVNQRLTRKSSIPSLEVCIFIQEDFKEFGEFMNLKIDLIYKCLSSYFFPGNQVVTVSVQRDLKQFLFRTVFQKTSVVKDMFGVRHFFEDGLNIKAVLLVSKSVSALLRHQDLCILDTLPMILGIDRETLLVLNQLGVTFK